MNTIETLLYNMARWAQRAENAVPPLHLFHPIDEARQEHPSWLAEGRRLREQADRLVGFPRGVR